MNKQIKYLAVVFGLLFLSRVQASEKQIVFISKYKEPVSVSVVEKGRFWDTEVAGYLKDVLAGGVLFIKEGFLSNTAIKWHKRSSLTGGIGSSKYFSPATNEKYIIMEVYSAESQKSFGEKLAVGAQKELDYKVVFAAKEKPDRWDELTLFARDIYKQSIAGITQSESMFTLLRRFDDLANEIVGGGYHILAQSKKIKLISKELAAELLAVARLTDFVSRLRKWEKGQDRQELDILWKPHVPGKGADYQAFYEQSKAYQSLHKRVSELQEYLGYGDSE